MRVNHLTGLGLGLLLSLNCGQLRGNESILLLTNPAPFFSTSDKTGQPGGYSVELGKGILREAGYEPVTIALPWARLMRWSAKHKGHLISDLARTSAREHLYHWITPVTRNPIAIYASRSDIAPLESLTDLAKLGSIAVLRDDYRVNILHRAKVSNVIAFNTWPQAVGSLIKGRVDSLFLSDLGLILTCFEHNLDCSQIHKVYDYQLSDIYLAMPKTSTSAQTASKLINAAQKYKASSAFQQMAKEHLSENATTSHAMSLKEGVITIDS